MKYYDLIISTKVSENVYRITSSNRMAKDGDLTIDEVYSILYKAILGIDSTSVQASIISLMPNKEFNESNATLLNKILASLEFKGVRIELIEVYNATSDTLDSGILSYVTISKSPIISHFVTANLFSYVNENTQLSKIQLDLLESAIPEIELREVTGLQAIALNYDSATKLGMNFSSSELPEFLRSLEIDYRVYGEF